MFTTEGVSLFSSVLVYLAMLLTKLSSNTTKSSKILQHTSGNPNNSRATSLPIPVHTWSEWRDVSYLYELLVCLVNLTENAGSVFHKIFDCIHVVERDEKDVLGSGTEKHLVLESHGHQVIELWRGRRAWLHWLIQKNKMNAIVIF